MMNKKSLKPIDTDIHLKYRCTNKSCEQDHWLSIKEAKTKNFKIVCDCGLVFKPKLVNKIKILYKSYKPKIQKEKIQHQTIPQAQEQKIEIDIDLLQKCAKVLIGYGFTSEESETLIKQSYTKNPTNDIASIIKNVLESIGDNL